MSPDPGAETAAELPGSPRPGPGRAPARVGVTLDGISRRATLEDGTTVPLTPLQFAILEYMVERAGSACSRESLMREALGYARPVGSRTVDMHVASLRHKLGSGFPIKAVRGVGYLVPRSEITDATGGRDPTQERAG